MRKWKEILAGLFFSLQFGFDIFVAKVLIENRVWHDQMYEWGSKLSAWQLQIDVWQLQINTWKSSVDGVIEGILTRRYR